MGMGTVICCEDKQLIQNGHHLDGSNHRKLLTIFHETLKFEPSKFDCISVYYMHAHKTSNTCSLTCGG